ncbi:MAG: hypothetical protein HY690_05235 [Chloroflexi bacterium]|nr:hypothetical protein [Chloroflexota bacterium]
MCQDGATIRIAFIRMAVGLAGASFGLTLLLLAGCAAPPVSSLKPTPNVDATIQAAVGTAVAQERARPTPTPVIARESWLRAGREFFAMDQGAERVAEGYARLIMRPRSGNLGDVMAKETKLRNQVTLLPLPATAEGEQVRFDLAFAIGAIAALRAEARVAVEQDSAELPTWDRDSKAGKAWSEFQEKWRTGRETLVKMLRQNNISMADLGPESGPPTGREVWLKVGREFMLLDRVFEEVYDSYLSTGLGQVKVTSDMLYRLSESRPKEQMLLDGVSLLPLPSSPEAVEIRRRLDDFVEKFYAARKALWVLTGGDSTEFGRAWKACYDTWRGARVALFDELRQRGVSMTDLGVVLPAAQQGTR